MDIRSLGSLNPRNDKPESPSSKSLPRAAYRLIVVSVIATILSFYRLPPSFPIRQSPPSLFRTHSLLKRVASNRTVIGISSSNECALGVHPNNCKARWGLWRALVPQRTLAAGESASASLGVMLRTVAESARPSLCTESATSCEIFPNDCSGQLLGSIISWSTLEIN